MEVKLALCSCFVFAPFLLRSCSALVFEHGSIFTFAKGFSVYMHLQKAFLPIDIVRFSSNFICVVCSVFACFLCELRALCE